MLTQAIAGISQHCRNATDAQVSGYHCDYALTTLRCLNADMAEEFPLLQPKLPHCTTHDFLWWQLVNCSSTSLDAADQALCDASEASLEIACKHAWHMRLCLSV